MWNGSKALVMGGRGDALSEEVLRVNTPGTASLHLENGTMYTVSLSATDEFGVTQVDDVSVLVDNVSPSLSVALPAVHFTNENEVTLHWNATDVTSGLWHVSVGNTTDNLTWAHSGNLISSSEQGVTSEKSFNHTLNLSPLVTGEQQVVEVRVEDRAGNVVEETLTVKVDRDLPDIVGDIVNENATGFITTAYLNTTDRVWDNASGLEEVRVWTYDDNTTSERELHHDTSMAGVEDSGRLWLNHTKPQPNATHKLNVTAVDRAGNMITAVIDMAEVQIAPKLDSIVPNYTWQEGERSVRFRGTTGVPGYAGLSVDAAWINVTNRETEATTVLDLGQVVGEFDVWWNASEATRESYDIEFYSVLGTSGRVVPHLFNTTFKNGSIQDLPKHYTYGTLNASGDQDLYRVEFPNECDDTFDIWVRGYSGQDVDFHFVEEDPEVARWNPANYTVHKNSTSDTEHHEVQSGGLETRTYSLLVMHKENLSDYEVQYSYSGCSGGGGGPKESPSRQLEKLELWRP